MLSCAVAFAALASCSAQQIHSPLPALAPSGDQQVTEQEAQYFVGLSAIQENFVLDIPIGTLSLIGLNGLASIDPGLSVHRSHDKVLLAQKDGENQTLNLPATSDAVAWAIFTHQAVKQARSSSPKLRSVHREQIYEAIFDSYTGVLDEYSQYWNPFQAKALWEQLLGFGGIGITLKFEKIGIRVVSVVKNSAAERAKIKQGDLIIAVDGVPFRNQDNPQDAVDQLRGEIGSDVWISLIRGFGRPLDVKVTRQEIVPETVETSRLGSVQLIRILSFNKNTARAVESVVRSLPGSGTTGVILDLRGNPGGLLPSSVKVSDMFLSGAIISQTRGRVDEANEVFFTKLPDLTEGIPLVVLVDKDAASAAEILAAAIQDNHRGVILGEVTYGKGSVQSSLPLPNKGRLNLTIAEFFGPSGTPLNKYGVVPDICVNRGNFQLASAVSNGQLRSASKHSRKLIAAGSPPASVRKLCAGSASSNGQATALALTLLSDRNLYHKALTLSPR
jgi:carboxyl-terminal processing protease